METNIEREVEEFRKKITSCTHVGGFHTCVISDPEDNEAYKERATNHFRDSLTRLQQETERREVYKFLLKVFLLLPSVSDGDKTQYACGVRDTVHNLRNDLKDIVDSITTTDYD